VPGEGPTLRVGAACKAWSTTAQECGCARGAGSVVWPREGSGQLNLTPEQFDWLVAGLPWQRLGAVSPPSITAIRGTRFGAWCAGVCSLANVLISRAHAREVLWPCSTLHLHRHSTPRRHALRAWLISKRQTLAKADVTARVIDYSLSNWAALLRRPCCEVSGLALAASGEVLRDDEYTPSRRISAPISPGWVHWPTACRMRRLSALEKVRRRARGTTSQSLSDAMDGGGGGTDPGASLVLLCHNVNF